MKSIIITVAWLAYTEKVVGFWKYAIKENEEK